MLALLHPRGSAFSEDDVTVKLQSPRVALEGLRVKQFVPAHQLSGELTGYHIDGATMNSASLLTFRRLRWRACVSTSLFWPAS